MKISVIIFFFLILTLNGKSQAVHPMKVNSQTVKIAYFNKDSLLLIMPDVNLAKDSLHAYCVILSKKLEALDNVYENKQNLYDSKSPDSGVKNQMEKELAELQLKISAFQDSCLLDSARYEKKLFDVINKKINNAAAKVATEKGYEFVLDSSPSTGTVIYASGTDNIFTDMCAELKIPLPAK